MEMETLYPVILRELKFCGQNFVHNPENYDKKENRRISLFLFLVGVTGEQSLTLPCIC